MRKSSFPLWMHVCVMVSGAVALLALLLWLMTGEHTSPLSKDPDDRTVLEVIRLVFYAVAGIGGVVALTVAYRRQRLNEATEEREDAKLFNERFAAAADQLSSDQATKRLAGVYAMAALGDEWDAGRQTCVNVLCAYLRLPYAPPPLRHEREGQDVEEFRPVLEERLIRHTVVSEIAERLREQPFEGRTWHWCRFEFKGAVFDGINFDRGVFKGPVTFAYARFPVAVASFEGTRFEGPVDFYRSRVNGGEVRFEASVFTDEVSFRRMEIDHGLLSFELSYFYSEVSFEGAKVTDGAVDFTGTGFADSEIRSALQREGKAIKVFFPQGHAGTADTPGP